VELRGAVGAENFLLFGLEAEEARRLRRDGYDPRVHVERSPGLRGALDLIASGFFSLGERERFRPIVDSLLHEDRYFVCADFDGYVAAEARAGDLYRDPLDWSRRALLNIAGASRFSADDTVRAYATDIWGIHPVAVDLGRLAKEL
jgi:starch phosphorylase